MSCTHKRLYEVDHDNGLVYNKAPTCGSLSVDKSSWVENQGVTDYRDH
jgi:hypothetical protein